MPGRRADSPSAKTVAPPTCAGARSKCEEFLSPVHALPASLSRPIGMTAPASYILEPHQPVALGAARADVIGTACCHRHGPSNGPVGGPVGQGVQSPWPATFGAHNRLRHAYLRTMSQPYAAVGRKNRILGWLCPAPICSPQRWRQAEHCRIKTDAPRIFSQATPEWRAC